MKNKKHYMKNIFLVSHALIYFLICLGFVLLAIIGMTGLFYHSIFSDQSLLESNVDFLDLVNLIVVPQINFIKKAIVVTSGNHFESSSVGLISIYGIGMISIGISGLIYLRNYSLGLNNN